MKDKKLIDTVMHYLVHNSFIFTVLIVGMVHVIMLPTMIYLKVQPLISFNILSIVIYIFCLILGKLGHILPAYLSTIIEITVYTIVSIYCLGWDCGSCCFLISLIPIVIYFGCLLFKGAKRWIVVLLLTFIFVLYISLFLMFFGKQPIYVLPDFVNRTLICFTSFVMVFGIIFYNALYIYSSESTMNNLQQENIQLTADAQVDSLTGLLNRRGFLPIIEGILNKTDPDNFSIAFCDIDNFKRINDSYGHDCGDEVLRHISRTLKKELPGCDICRWGGEEMVILMKDYDLSASSHKMEDIRKKIEQTPAIFFNKRIPATVTIGLEEYAYKYNNAEDIIKVADERMYYGKQHGKNMLVYVSVE